MSDGHTEHSYSLEQQQQQQQQRRFAGRSGRILGARSASPAKRSAADMEGSHQSPVDDAMDTQESVRESVETSVDASMTTTTDTTSFESDQPPPYVANSGADVPSIDTQVATVMKLLDEATLDEGTKGYVVSWKWLSRVMSRSSEGMQDSKYTKEAREGPIGPINNEDIVPAGSFDSPILKDAAGKLFIPLKPGLSMGEDFYVLPDQAYGLVVSWYGNTPRQTPIIRYVHNTAGEDATAQNMVYDLWPPVITVRKVYQPRPELEDTVPPKKSSFEERRLLEERRARGQLSPDDAVKFVSSRSERFNEFLKRSKDATGIPRNIPVRIWKLLDPTKTPLDKPEAQKNGVLSPPHSRSTSPKPVQTERVKLLIDPDDFMSMELSKELEYIDVRDATNDANFNGRSTMQVHGLYEDMTVVLEEVIGGPGGGEYASDSKKINSRLGPTKKILESKPGSANVSGRTSPAPVGMMTRGRQRRDGRTRGTVGLSNLGNTCYMNSALQCIRSVEELAIYFLSKKYKSEINNSNPLGHHGAMANRYAELLQLIYADNAPGSITPSAFRKTLGSIQPMFSGYGQQDSQEFLSFLVDALHEDLNRILKKPYNENPDSDDKTVHDPEAIIKLGETYRSNHKARNDSVAMDLFSGFYKNTMECPVCDKISITFDPYSLLTVQLPIESTFQHNITFIPLHGRPVNHSIDIDKNATIKMLKEYIASKHNGVKADRLWMAEVYSHKIYKIFENSTTLAEASIQTNDYLFVFELDAVPTNPVPPAEKKSMYSYSISKPELAPDMDDARADQFVVPVFSRKKGKSGFGWENILHPMYIIVTREEAKDYDTVLKKVLIAASRLTSRAILSEMDANTRDHRDPTSNVEMKDESSAEDSAQVSEHSVDSEDGYVEVSLDKSEQSSSNGEQTNGTTEQESEDHVRSVPHGFMDSAYFLSPDLRNNLFVMNYVQSESGGLHCSGMSSVKESSISVMADRVKVSARRSSVQSSSSGEESTTSTGSGAQANGVESDDSDAADMDQPDIRLSEAEEESSLAFPPPIQTLSDDESLPDSPFQMPISRKGRRKNNKHAGKRKNKLVTYGKKGQQRGHRQTDSGASYHSAQSNRGFNSKLSSHNDSPYYIKLGEGIVLDWLPQAYDVLFAGKPNDSSDERGHFLSSHDGKNLPFVHDEQVEQRRTRRETRKKHGITLGDCFIETGKREVLSEDNAWYCNRCKELRRATKTLEIWTIPDILVVHLKRFGGNRSFRDKIDVLVDYPIEGLDMTDRIGLKEDGKEYVYDLFAVDNHFGGLGGGHYTALAKNFYDGEWYDYNDSSCTKVSGENRLHSAAAYLLFYRRRSDKPLGPQYLQDLVYEARNPPDTAGEPAAEDSDSGEGRLGGPNGSFLLGSSSALNGAGVGPASLLPNPAGNGSAGAGATQPVAASSSPIQRRTINPRDDADDEGQQVVYGPQRPMQFGNRGSEWSFNHLDQERDRDDDDATSTTAIMDDAAGRMDEDFNGFGDHDFSNASSHAGPTPVASDGEDFQDDHRFYSNSRGGYDDALLLPDAGTMGEEEPEDSTPVHDIYPDPAHD